MNRDEFMELVYETFADEPDNVLANGIIEAADAYAEHEKAQLFSEGAISDLISRRAAVDAFEDTTFTKNEIRRRLSDLPPAQPEYRLDEWCHDCKEYDQENHCCPRFNRVIREALKDAQHEPKEGHWIPHESPDGGEQYECSECGVLWEFNDGTPEDNEAYFCPKCGSYLGGGQK